MSIPGSDGVRQTYISLARTIANGHNASPEEISWAISMLESFKRPSPKSVWYLNKLKAKVGG
jgi:hypothetical protein